MPDDVKIKDGAQVLNEQRERDVEKLAEKYTGLVVAVYHRTEKGTFIIEGDLDHKSREALARVALEFCEERGGELPMKITCKCARSFNITSPQKGIIEITCCECGEGVQYKISEEPK